MKRPKPQKHWTETSILDYQSRITFDFLAQLEKRMELLPMSQAKLARELGISESAVSQVLNNPAGLNLSTIIKYSRKLGLKVALVAYDDNDPDNTGGPINSEIFSACWKYAGKPADFFDLEKLQKTSDNISSSDAFADKPVINPEIGKNNAYLLNGVASIGRLTDSQESNSTAKVSPTQEAQQSDIVIVRAA